MTESPIVWPDATRARAFSAWLQTHAPTHGLLPETVQPASADASFRRYFRVRTADGGSCIIMDAPPAQEDCAPFVKVAGLMAGAGLNAPRVLAWDQAQGFMLLSDLGARTMLEVIEQQPKAGKAQRAYDLYREAVDVLVRWQLASKPDVLPPYDEALLSRELALFPDWYVEKHRGITVDSTLRGKLDGLFAQIKDSNLNSLGGARVFVHRDFMPRNLIAPTLFTSCASGVALPLTSGTGADFSRGGPSDNFTTATGNSGLGILDFQDAVYGPITYDIASLMRDAFISWPEDFVLEITVRYWEQARKAGLPVGDDFGEFYRAVEWMGLQRHLKILGIFARLTLRDGKPKYLADTPRFITYARATCARYRQLGPLMVLLDEIEGNETRVGYTF
ncbi:MAG: phosphotransferase [Polaromonas sp.]|uniref:aminoglycoside phosphotransferase family protein n=1 Tax=Polaromonas sp. TaxID=1869339 RepID=UPI002489A4B4|nr:phosphotransferase [Polaromonas sp.]MDI1271088.1 phosphotransferase [Polaromonas sp.]